MATPTTIGKTDNIRCHVNCLPAITPMTMVTTGTNDRITWLKFTETWLRLTLPTATFRENMTEKKRI